MTIAHVYNERNAYKTTMSYEEKATSHTVHKVTALLLCNYWRTLPFCKKAGFAIVVIPWFMLWSWAVDVITAPVNRSTSSLSWT